MSDLVEDVDVRFAVAVEAAFRFDTNTREMAIFRQHLANVGLSVVEAGSSLNLARFIASLAQYMIDAKDAEIRNLQLLLAQQRLISDAHKERMVDLKEQLAVALRANDGAREYAHELQAKLAAES